VIPGTVAFSFGLSVLGWRHLIGLHLHWLVRPITFVIPVAVGSGCNLLLVARVKEEIEAGLHRASSDSWGRGSGGRHWCDPVRYGSDEGVT
jgi:uncharacterized membrane protein YdfJ with MMPL/SSD domain